MFEENLDEMTENDLKNTIQNNTPKNEIESNEEGLFSKLSTFTIDLFRFGTEKQKQVEPFNPNKSFDHFSLKRLDTDTLVAND